MTSLVSANGPSVTRADPSATRTVLAISAGLEVAPAPDPRVVADREVLGGHGLPLLVGVAVLGARVGVDQQCVVHGGLLDVGVV